MDKEPSGPSSPGSRSAGGFGLFGSSSAGPQYSKRELAGVPLTGMSPLSPYLNVDPRYLLQDTDEFILPTGANKTRGRFELAFFTIGGCCITGAVFGAVNGLRMGLSETRNMAWSKPRNVQLNRIFHCTDGVYYFILHLHALITVKQQRAVFTTVCTIAFTGTETAEVNFHVKVGSGSIQ
uniref:Translocase of inner mitochondrial membrane 23 homolog b (yeast) n=1 Tax=Cyprinus carpio carpio TaxID=630221 RepID=A0A9J7ZFP2_CYPCA